MSSAALAALAAALCWTLSSLLWRRLSAPISAVQLNQVKNVLALSLQLPLLLASWRSPGGRELALLLASGVLGIALGDSFFFAALRRLGTRRTLTIEAAGPALTTVSGMVLLQEWPGPLQLLGVALISAAVVLVVRTRPEAAQQPQAAAAGRRRWQGGLILALLAVVCGSLGALLARAALRGGQVPPLQASSLRLLAASLVLLPVLRFGRRDPVPLLPLIRSAWRLLLPATVLGTSLGIALQQTALAGLPGGLAVALLSTAPVMALPLGWLLEGDRPDRWGVLAGLAAVAGVSLVALAQAGVG